jgi:hypothetical protein
MTLFSARLYKALVLTSFFHYVFYIFVLLFVNCLVDLLVLLLFSKLLLLNGLPTSPLNIAATNVVR